MKINEVIERHGMQLRDVSREMGMKPSALQSAIDRNLTVKTLRLISEASRIPIAEFFFDEMTEEEISRLTNRPDTDRPSPAPSLSGRGVDTTEPQDNSRPSIQGGDGGGSLLQQAIICPHCHQALVFNIAAYEQK